MLIKLRDLHIIPTTAKEALPTIVLLRIAGII